MNNNKTLFAGDILDTTPGLTYRKLDNWCRNGCLGELDVDTRGRRQFTPQDLQIIQVLTKISIAFENQAPLMLYTAIADAMRAATSVANVEIIPGIELHIDMAHAND